MYGYVSMSKCSQLAPTGKFHRAVIWSSCPAGQCMTVNLCLYWLCQNALAKTCMLKFTMIE